MTSPADHHVCTIYSWTKRVFCPADHRIVGIFFLGGLPGSQGEVLYELLRGMGGQKEEFDIGIMPSPVAVFRPMSCPEVVE
ncbi:uncharacterized protein [Oryza sativa Japonica Group]|uniref:uncharacterized protein isoform X3 n=1 Tax=Oryza sativa subsp. japonica TaxID=39947 RepID=UPI00339BAAF9